jgi:integrative and conjugative element protein (TIGR02256 family)
MSVAENEVLFEGESIKVHVNKSVYKCWLKHRQLKTEDTEQFGVLIGSRTEDESNIWIDRCTTPQTKDVSRRASFTLKDPYHQTFIDKVFAESDGEMGYIGTWHTHPQNNPAPSGVDIADWANCTHRNPNRQLLFVIVGNKQVCIYINIVEKIERLTRKING